MVLNDLTAPLLFSGPTFACRIVPALDPAGVLGCGAIGSMRRQEGEEG